jgi:hypothetical protein
MSFSDYLATGGKVLNEDIDPKHAPDGKKTYYRMDNIGKSKYSINFHDGVQTHKDGSKFYDIRIFKNKPGMEAFIRELHDKGYVYGKRPIYEAATSGTLPGIRAVREYLDLEPGDTSKDEEIRAMSFKEYLGHYLAWEGIIGYTATIAAIADALHDKK